ncbi:putative acyltransferase [Calothrix sp. NIES-2100]|uniref:acyltransferase family protein n=1 Tax=Calothrix sp. NIES-2100 TaxID=1954172 RepID=UPI000B5E93FE|nr:putative acyltransferase [Calothrix sp. NIES-2100]
MIKQELLPLTSLRFISAFWVFLFHITLRWPLKLPVPVSNIVSQGALGMSIFFILSGFILTYNYFEQEPIKEYRDFVIKRFARIYPIYILASLVTLPWFVIPQISTDIPNVILRSFTYLIVVIINLFLLQAWFPSLFNYWINGSTWSLSVECFFYLLFPNILSVFKKISIKSLKKLLFVLYFLSIIPGIIFMSPLEPKVLSSTVYALPIYRLPECIIGMIVAVIFIDKTRSHQRPAAITFKLIFCLLLLTTYLSLFAHTLPLIYVSHNFLVIPIIALFIYYCAHISQGFIYRLLSNNFFVLLGKISYSFYLMQSLPIFFTEKNYELMLALCPILKNNYILALIILVFNLSISSLLYYFVETPLRKRIIKVAKTKSLIK